ncbi:hypothetical protein B0H63DRAFT_224106 [Podospora didyma]|uniref:Uncharacterized protein n=1 Tax=Podospora didyma TaxID=330526 RepID=A0AAE0NBB9_9PEZI|nr:hypothetical protein B0H63DRAFT_224106 [Podospora didyma]
MATSPNHQTPGNGNGFPDPNLTDDLENLSLDQNPESRAYHEARRARENATVAEIEASGIAPNVRNVVKSLNESPSPLPLRIKLDDTSVRRIFQSPHKPESGSTSGKGSNQIRNTTDAIDAKVDEDFRLFIEAGGVADLDPQTLRRSQLLIRSRVRRIEQAGEKWRALKAETDPPQTPPSFDIIASLSSSVELIVEVCKHLTPAYIVRLYSISRAFHDAINQYMQSSTSAWARCMAPNAARLYTYELYRPMLEKNSVFIPDPARHRGPRMIHGLKWLQLIVQREIQVRDILATLARMGHRMPKGSSLTLLKLWMVMDIATSAQRVTIMQNKEFFTNQDLYITQQFFVKLLMRFNDPIFGPASTALLQLMMGQRGLTPLWALLRRKKYTVKKEIETLKVLYDVAPDAARVHTGQPYMDVPISKMGTFHFEGWGTGSNHLMRPDELLAVEAVRRDLDLVSAIRMMIIYGHVNLSTGCREVPSIEEMYMSDDELPQDDWSCLKTAHAEVLGGCGNVPFEPDMWQPKHARKARWNTLTEEQKKLLLEAEEDEIAQQNKYHYSAEHDFVVARKKYVDELTATRRRLDRFSTVNVIIKGEELPANTPHGLTLAGLLDPSEDAESAVSHLIQHAQPSQQPQQTQQSHNNTVGNINLNNLGGWARPLAVSVDADEMLRQQADLAPALEDTESDIADKALLAEADEEYADTDLQEWERFLHDFRPDDADEDVEMTDNSPSEDGMAEDIAIGNDDDEEEEEEEEEEDERTKYLRTYYRGY